MSQRLALSTLLIPLAAGLAIWTYGRAQADPAAGAETLFLALLVTVVLLPVAALAVRPTLELGIPAVLITTAVWVVPAGPARGAAVSLLLLSTLAVAALHRFDTDQRRLSWNLAIPLALALQMLIRSDRLVGLELDLRNLVGLIGLPVAAAAALVVLARRRRATRVLVAGGAVLILVPGYSVSVTLALLTLAVADLVRNDPAGDGPVHDGPVRDDPIPEGEARARSVLDGWLPRWARWAGGLLLAGTTLAWEPTLALPILACAAIHASRGSWRVVGGVAAAMVVATTATMWLLPAARSTEQCLHQLALVPLVLPALAVLCWRRPATALGGALVGAAALRLVPDPGALAAPLALMGLALDEASDSEELQPLWTGLLAAGVTLLAAYPWVRDLPLVDAAALAGLKSGWPSALLVVTVFLLLGVGTGKLGGKLRGKLRSRWPRSTPAASTMALLLVGLGIFVSLPPDSVRPLGDQVVLVTAERPRLTRDLATSAGVSEVVIDSYLSDSAMLATGTPVADVRLITIDGRRQISTSQISTSQTSTSQTSTVQTWTLHAGVETGEWAARREDVAGLPGFAAPMPWLSWVAPGGQVLAQRYRSRWRPEAAAGEPAVARRIEIVRRADLPAGVSLAVFHLELRP